MFLLYCRQQPLVCMLRKVGMFLFIIRTKIAAYHNSKYLKHGLCANIKAILQWNHFSKKGPVLPTILKLCLISVLLTTHPPVMGLQILAEWSLTAPPYAQWNTMLFVVRLGSATTKNFSNRDYEPCQANNSQSVIFCTCFIHTWATRVCQENNNIFLND